MHRNIDTTRPRWMSSFQSDPRLWGNQGHTCPQRRLHNGSRAPSIDSWASVSSPGHAPMFIQTICRRFWMGSSRVLGSGIIVELQNRKAMQGQWQFLYIHLIIIPCSTPKHSNLPRIFNSKSHAGFGSPKVFQDQKQQMSRALRTWSRNQHLMEALTLYSIHRKPVKPTKSLGPGPLVRSSELNPFFVTERGCFRSRRLR